VARRCSLSHEPRRPSSENLLEQGTFGRARNKHVPSREDVCNLGKRFPSSREPHSEPTDVEHPPPNHESAHLGCPSQIEGGCAFFLNRAGTSPPPYSKIEQRFPAEASGGRGAAPFGWTHCPAKAVSQHAATQIIFVPISVPSLLRGELARTNPRPVPAPKRPLLSQVRA